jgi:hypothetical protein
MSIINEQTKDFWQKLAVDLDATRPSIGKFVRIEGGRKHKGKTGRVIRHQIDKFGTAYRYKSDAQAHMADMRGREGWACQVECGQDEHGATIRVWVKAHYCTVIQEAGHGD